MAYGKRVFIEAVREVAFGSITGSYTTVGAVTAHNARLVIFNNSTDKDLYLSVDGSTNNFRIASNSFKLIDLTANMSSNSEDAYFLPIQTQFWVKQTSAGAPGSGNLWIEVIGASGGP